MRKFVTGKNLNLYTISCLVFISYLKCEFELQAFKQQQIFDNILVFVVSLSEGYLPCFFVLLVIIINLYNKSINIINSKLDDFKPQPKYQKNSDSHY